MQSGFDDCGETSVLDDPEDVRIVHLLHATVVHVEQHRKVCAKSVRPRDFIKLIIKYY